MLRAIYSKFSFDREIISGRQHIHTTVDKRNGHWDKWRWHRVQGTGPRECTFLTSHGLTFMWRAAVYIGEHLCICCVLRISWKFPLSIYRPPKKSIFFCLRNPSRVRWSIVRKVCFALSKIIWKLYNLLNAYIFTHI